MTLIVETGAIVPGAESYATVTQFKAYCDARGITYGTDPQIEQQLRLATDFMVANYRDRWRGVRCNNSQTLDWPRYAVMLDDIVGVPGANLVPPNIVPTPVVNACILLATRAVAPGTVTPSATALQPDIKRVVAEAGAGQMKVRYDPNAPVNTVFPAIEGMLVPYFHPGNTGPMMRIERA